MTPPTPPTMTALAALQTTSGSINNSEIRMWIPDNKKSKVFANLDN
jgi:hypothetical protein